MSLSRLMFGLACCAPLVAGCDSDDDAAPGGAAGTGQQGSKTNFFVSSDKSTTGNLGGLSGADARCKALADAAGLTGKTWRAYLSVEHDAESGGAATNARDRIGTGPFYNANEALLANDVAELHARSGDAELFVDEHGQKIPGQWAGSPGVEHDILTGSTAEGTVLANMTCADWTSADATMAAQVGHSDGLGPGMSATPPFNSWQSSHPNESCANTVPRGGAGRIYCFGVN